MINLTYNIIFARFCTKTGIVMALCLTTYHLVNFAHFVSLLKQKNRLSNFNFQSSYNFSFTYTCSTSNYVQLGFRLHLTFSYCGFAIIYNNLNSLVIQLSVIDHLSYPLNVLIQTNSLNPEKVRTNLLVALKNF